MPAVPGSAAIARTDVHEHAGLVAAAAAAPTAAGATTAGFGRRHSERVTAGVGSEGRDQPPHAIAAAVAAHDRVGKRGRRNQNSNGRSQSAHLYSYKGINRSSQWGLCDVYPASMVSARDLVVK